MQTFIYDHFHNIENIFQKINVFNILATQFKYYHYMQKQIDCLRVCGYHK